MRSLISIDFPAPKMEPESACGISCLRSLAPMWRLRCSTTQATPRRNESGEKKVKRTVKREPM